MDYDFSSDGLLLDSVPDCGLVSVSLAFPGPEDFEKPGSFGFTGLVLELLRAGAGVVCEQEVMERFDQWGNGLSAYCLDGMAGLHYSCLPEALPDSLALLTQLLGGMAVAQPLVDREGGARRALIAEENDDPSTDAIRRVRLRAFGNRSLGHSPLGKEEDIQAATAESVNEFGNALLAKSRRVMAISGDFDPSLIRKQPLEKCKTPCGTEPPPAPGAFADWTRFDEVIHHPRQQSVVATVFGAGGIAGETAWIRQLTLACLNGLSGPLFEEIRERHGLAYYANAQLVAGRNEGLLSFLCGCEASKVGFLRDRLAEILLRLGARGFTPEEFAAGQSQMRSGLLMSRQRTSWRAHRLAGRKIQGLEPDLGEATEAFLKKVTPEDLADWCLRNLHPEQSSTLTLLPEEFDQ